MAEPSAARQGILSLSIKEKNALYAAYINMKNCMLGKLALALFLCKSAKQIIYN
jgi:Tfp pilus assembly protein PilZ